MRDLALAYYFMLRTALRSRPGLRPLLTRCRLCRIFFLAHPRNRGRRDLGCPFGCRDAHRRKSSAKRSTAYYSTASGKTKKAQLNRKRRRARATDGAPAKDPEDLAEVEEADAEFDAVIVDHVRVVTSLIEGFDVSREQVIAMLERTTRQHSIFRRKRLDYVLEWLVEHSP